MKQKRLISIFLTLALVAATMLAGSEAVFANSASTAIQLTSGVSYSYAGTANETTYYKIYSPSNGYITVKFNDSTSGYSHLYYMSVLNYKQNNLYSGSETISQSLGDNTRNIGVAKGTYYLAVKSSSDSYGITATHYAVTENSGSKRSKAKKMYKGYSKRGIITAAQSSTSGDWYKFTIKKTQYVKFSVTTKTSGGGSYGGLKLSMYQAGKSYAFGTRSFYYSNPSDTLRPYTYGKAEKLAAGTYYIKIQKYSNGNGYYKIKWLS